MARFFVSYARIDADCVNALVRALEFLGHDVWIDRELIGGHNWWEDILANIRLADVFVVGLSAPYLDSTPCRAEHGYASSLGKVTLPVLVGDVVPELLPADLSSIQHVDYRSPDEESALALAKAINALPAPKPLPDPLPPAPELTLSSAPAAEKVIERVTAEPSPLVRPLAALFWGAIIAFFIFPLALLSAVIVLVVLLGIFGLDQSQTHLGWTLVLTAVIGWGMWVCLSKWLRWGMELAGVWWRRRRASAMTANPQ